jgi:putative transposase
MATILPLRALAMPVSAPMALDRVPSPDRMTSANRKRLLVELVLNWMAEGATKPVAIRIVLAKLRAGEYPSVYLDASAALAKRGKQHVSDSSLERWVDEFRSGGVSALTDDYRGKRRKPQPWDAQAQEYFEYPSHPNCGDIAHWLNTRHPEFAGLNITDAQVRSLKKHTPSNHAETSPKRLGRHHYDLTHKPFRIIDPFSVPPGDEWEIDGHRCDVYVAHPRSGKHYRPELTWIVDKGSGIIVAWTLGDNESAWNTLWTISLAIRRTNHLPLFIHADPGSMKARMLASNATGFCEALGIRIRFTHPGNAHGKGMIERSFGVFESRVGKLFHETYCGHVRTDDALQRLESKIRRGLIPLPAQASYEVEIERHRNIHNHLPDEARAGRIRWDLWETRKARAIAHPSDAIARPMIDEPRVVQNWRVRHGNRFYEAPELAAYEKREVVFEYEMDDDREVYIYDLNRRFICIAKLVSKIAGIPQSRLEEQEQISLREKLRRLENKAEEHRARTRGTITADETLKGLEDLGAIVLPPPKEEIEGLPPLDLLDTDY